MPYRVTTPPPVEPVTLAEVKEHLRIDHSDHDTMLEGLIQASREHVEMTTGRALVGQTRVASFPTWGVFALPGAPVQSVSAIRYTDTSGTINTVPADNYVLLPDRTPAAVVRAHGAQWPGAAIYPDAYPIEVEYVCGYEPVGSPVDYTAEIPESIKNAIKLDVELRYDRPPEGYSERLEQVIKSLLAPYRVWWGAV